MLLRQLVAGVRPISSEEHPKIWSSSRSAVPPSASTSMPSSPVAQLAKPSGRVASMVQDFEAVSLSAHSRPYAAIPASPTSSDANAPPRLPPLSTTTTKQAYLGRSTASPRSAPPEGTSNPTSPTVPASVFQKQQSRRMPTSPEAEKRSRSAQPTPTSVAGKENQFHSPTPSRPLSFHAPAGSNAPSALALAEPFRRSTLGSLGDDWETMMASSQISVETMATRATDSTHMTTSSENSNPSLVSAEHAQIGQVQVVDAGRRVNEVPTVLSASNLRPQIIETRPTPRKPPSPILTRTRAPGSSRLLGAETAEAAKVKTPDTADWLSSRPLSAAQLESSARASSSPPLPLIPAWSPSLFTEDLSQSGKRISPAHRELSYAPLLMGDQTAPPPPIAKDEAPTRRQRANTLGGGLKAPFSDLKPVRVETAEEKEARIEEAFSRLLVRPKPQWSLLYRALTCRLSQQDTMQLPNRSVRTKMLGLALPLKEEMLRASHLSSPTPSSHSTSSHAVPSVSVQAARPNGAHHQRGRSLNNAYDSPPITPATTKKESSFKSVVMRKSKSNSSLRAAASLPVTSSKKRGDGSATHSRTSSATSIILRSFGKSSGKDVAPSASGPSTKSAVEGEDAVWWAVRMRSSSSSALEVHEVARMRRRLRNETPGWVNDFLTNGGYVGMLERLKELLEMEWREEQHDDQLLQELLRCFKALTMTACGKRALASRSPTPFLPLANLLFSEKRPGDLACRQLLVELLLSLFDLCPVDAAPIPASEWTTLSLMSLHKPLECQRRYTRKMKVDPDEDVGEEVFDASRIEGTRLLVRSMMLGPPDEKEEAKVDFIKNAHRARPFKKWMVEMSDCVRDYFWIFCHAQNLFWSLEQINVEQVEAPAVPSGMTGGVEYEAMAYCATHFRLINALASACATPEIAFAFHQELFESGFERILLTLRRASLVYYPTLHLELSRYISLARSVRFNLGSRVLACIDARTLSREEHYVLELARQHHQAQKKAPTSPSGAPQLELNIGS
ncbi:BZ3500_MvSof-1268-A1-R1_Chr11-2g03376 [Microbotryum saponariae]|uniref:BZ3500_MvSof-1268-A1-R1_Chr11-2g03376 protein n=1 Tax=Microbotryum saponariae TaxID=289078 RepID=A0A2X0KSL0_9BASI|nr:BZ3500_MvSof-1268-A1-R1_Chr11-2g03376 [Microbotryum saponariae]SDA03232.1 BZ3501_MvSof-1269-A2-R1_Chr11g02947 [Microbotryum saponariae]